MDNLQSSANGKTALSNPNTENEEATLYTPCHEKEAAHEA